MWAEPATAAGNAPILRASIEGDLSRSPRLLFRLSATVPGGWQNVDKLQVVLLLHSVVLDQILFDQRSDTVSATGSLPVKVGSASEVTGTYFRFNGRDVRMTSGGNTLSLSMGVSMLRDPPVGAVFTLGVIDDLAQAVRVVRSVKVPEASGGGFSWGTLGLAIAAALFAGGFVGNTISSHRRRPPAPSIYDMVERRLRIERAKPARAQNAPVAADGAPPT